MELSEVIRNRRSVRSYDGDAMVTDEDLKAIFEEVVLSPSSFNLQHWTFIVVREHELKTKLKELAFNQQQVEDAPAAILVCGKVDAHKDAERIFEEVPQPVKDGTLPMIRNFYDGKPSFCRDEAIRSASFAAMALMLSAANLGFATGPMIGFDSEGVGKLLGLGPGYIPVMLIVLGKEKGESRPRAYRRPLDEVVKLETLGGAGLG